MCMEVDKVSDKVADIVVKIPNVSQRGSESLVIGGT